MQIRVFSTLNTLSNVDMFDFTLDSFVSHNIRLESLGTIIFLSWVKSRFWKRLQATVDVLTVSWMLIIPVDPVN